MKVQAALDNRAREAIWQIGRADLLIGIPSYHNESTIGHVARAAAVGTEKFFPDRIVVLMNSDGGSKDETRERFLSTPVSERVSKLATRYLGPAGKGSAFKAIFEAAVLVSARACVVVDSDLRSITPEWIRLLTKPIMDDDADYVAPLYLRHKYDGTITNSLAYPLTRALYGQRVRQPIGGDFGFSGKLAERYLEKDVWQTAAAQFGIDIFMTTTAVNEGFRIAQANLGAKIHDAKDPAAHLGPMFRQVVGTMFSLMRAYEGNWLNIRGSNPVATVGEPLKPEPEPVPVNMSALVQRFKDGVSKLNTFWRRFLSEAVMMELRAMAELEESAFSFPAQVWVKVVYEFAAAFHKAGLDQDEVVDSLTPLYFGRTAGFVRETEAMDSQQAEEVIERMAELFEREKQYLVSLWSKQ